MSAELPNAEQLHRAGFEFIARLNYRFRFASWWNPSPDALMQVLVVPVGDAVLIKADKSYFMQSVSESGETWARDLPALHDWLEAHLPEVRVAFSHFRDVPAGLAEAEVRRRSKAITPAQVLPPPEELARLQEQLQRRTAAIASDASLAELLGPVEDTLRAYLHHRSRREQATADALETDVRQQQERVGLLQHLQHEYQRNGSAAVYTFAIHSSLQLACDADEFASALRAVMREIRDQHRYHVLQKLQGGRLNIQLSECDQPAIAWIEQWFGGTLSPMQLARIEQAGRPLPLSQDHVMVTPDEPIRSDAGAVQADAKRVGARVLSTMISRLDRTETEAQRRAVAADAASADAMPLNVGLLTDAAGRDLGPAVLPLGQIIHAAISGTTGSGKSYLARVLVEEAAQIAGLGILVLDPRNQFSGLLVGEDRPAILSQYAAFGMDSVRARGFDFAYYAPALPESPLPESLASLATGHAIVSLKGLDDAKRCEQAAAVLTEVFDALGRRGESDHPRLLIVVDEAHLFTRKRVVDDDAIASAVRAEAAIDRLVREGRKYGIVVILVSQAMKDFSRDLASVRQMTSTKVFLRNSDNEIDYAADVLGDGRPLVNLPTGVAIVHNAAWGVRRFRVRPPLSKMCELGDAQIRQLMGKPLLRREHAVSSEARTLLVALRDHCGVNGPVNMSQAAQLSGITSKRRLQSLIGELEQAGLVVSRKLVERGSPRLIEPAADSVRASDETPS
ncbi:MAG: hypothetical protein JWM57_3896 [Phycisphaerales bacterium]|nr:hypothetical protein [Phycisphaerales bacterium]